MVTLQRKSKKAAVISHNHCIAQAPEFASGFIRPLISNSHLVHVCWTERESKTIYKQPSLRREHFLKTQAKIGNENMSNSCSL